MNAHAHKGFEAEGREPEGYIDGCYEITLGKALGEFRAGDVFVFDMEKEPQPGEMVALRRPGMDGVQVGKLVTDLPTARWADMPFADPELRDGGFVFAFQALGDDVPRIIDMAVLDGIDGCVEVVHRPGADNENALAPKRAKDTPARGPDGRFLPRDHANPETEVEQAEERKPWEDVAAWTPERSFMFRLEGDLYQLTALSAMLETLLTPITHKMAGYDRPASAALDYAVTNLADAVREIEERYMAVRFPEKEADAA